MDGGGIESTALMTGEGGEENAAGFPPFAAKEEEFACCALVNCSNND